MRTYLRILLTVGASALTVVGVDTGVGMLNIPNTAVVTGGVILVITSIGFFLAALSRIWR